MGTYTFPANANLRVIAQVFRDNLVLQDPIFNHFPLDTVMSDTILWEQKDSFTGLQGVRGLGGPFNAVTPKGGSRFTITPGYYGDQQPIDEQLLARLRPLGSWGDALDATSLVTEAQEQLVVREVSRMRQVAWALAAAGTFSVQNAAGVVIHTDSYTPQTFTPTTLWSNLSSSTPIKDMRQAVLLDRGTGAAFDGSAVAYCNRTTLTYLLNNTNANDLGGKLIVQSNRNGSGGGSNIMTLDDLNAVFLANDLPKIVVHDKGYLADTGTFTTFIPDGKLVVFGMRMDGNRVGALVQTINPNNPNGMPGPFDAAIESVEPPKMIVVYRGVNYAPIMEYPGSVLIMAVA